MTTSVTNRRRWFSFSLRTMFVVTAAIALGAGLIARHQRLVAEEMAAINAIGEGEHYQWNLDGNSGPWLVPKWLISSGITSLHFGHIVGITFRHEPNVERITPYVSALPGLHTAFMHPKYVSDEAASDFAVRFPQVNIIRGHSRRTEKLVTINECHYWAAFALASLAAMAFAWARTTRDHRKPTTQH
jgi:hypothetical protein